MKKAYINIGIVLGIIFVVMVLAMVALVAVLPEDITKSGSIAMINLEGTISSESSEESVFGDYQPSVDDYIEWIEDAAEDDGTEAIIIKINSPGGEAIASEKLARTIKEASGKKVVVAYVESMAASAAYQAASSTDYIVAEKQSLVGNIGVRMEILHYYGLMDELGVNVTTIKSGEFKDIGSPTRPMTEEEQEMLQSIVDESYYEFVSWVAENRNMTFNETLEVADGRIYSGTQAMEAGLVDMVGTEEDAIDVAAEMANITDPGIYEYKSSSPGILGVKFNEAMYYFGYGVGKAFSETRMEEVAKTYEMFY